MKELVVVQLGIRMIQTNPMPATITQLRGKRAPSYQHLSAEQLEQMGDDTEAVWQAEFLDKRYWLEKRVSVEDIPRRRLPLVLDEAEIPF